LKVKGVTMVTSFGDEEQAEGEEDALLQVRPPVRPEIGPKLVQRGNEAGPLRRGLARRGGRGNGGHREGIRGCVGPI
jgi:hypothetical protein